MSHKHTFFSTKRSRWSVVWKSIAVYFENYTKCINKLCTWNADILNVRIVNTVGGSKVQNTNEEANAFSDSVNTCVPASQQDACQTYTCWSKHRATAECKLVLLKLCQIAFKITKLLKILTFMFEVLSICKFCITVTFIERRNYTTSLQFITTFNKILW
jgi:hypothetical protein